MFCCLSKQEIQTAKFNKCLNFCSKLTPLVKQIPPQLLNQQTPIDLTGKLNCLQFRDVADV
uniref:Uncharacterized protein n=1 Tax=Anguilla anguilla TaxID=7936 RepID=A0A0E9UHB4_ANGAN